MGNLCNPPKETASNDNKYKPPAAAGVPDSEDNRDTSMDYSFVGEQSALYSSVVKTPPVNKPQR